MWRPFRDGGMRRKPRFCSTSSMSCGIWAMPWMRFARANTDGCGPRSALQQGPEIHLAVAQGEPHARWQEGIDDVAFSQQAAQHGLCPQGELRPAVGLRARGLGAGLLRELACKPQVALMPTARQLLRRMDGPALRPSETRTRLGDRATSQPTHPAYPIEQSQ
jgi:hypothetical protein